MSSDVKQFNIARWAKLKALIRNQEGDDIEGFVYVLPGDIQRFESDGAVSKIFVTDVERTNSYVVLNTVEEIEAECNRALGALLEDVKKAANDEFIKRGLLKDPPFKMEAN